MNLYYVLIMETTIEGDWDDSMVVGVEACSPEQAINKVKRPQGFFRCGVRSVSTDAQHEKIVWKGWKPIR